MKNGVSDLSLTPFFRTLLLLALGSPNLIPANWFIDGWFHSSTDLRNL